MKRMRRLMPVGIGLLMILSVVIAGFAQIEPTNAEQEESRAEKAAAAMSLASESFVERIGIFPPGYEEQLSLLLQEYERAHGTGNARIIEYRGYQLIVPPSQTSLIDDARGSVDEQIAAQKVNTPSAVQQKKDKAAIRRILGAVEPIVYNATIGAYTDVQGYQYILRGGDVVSKSIGVTDVLRNQWAKTHPLLSDPDKLPQESPLLSEEQVRTLADSLLERLNLTGREISLHERAAVRSWGRANMGLDYGEVKILVDRASGEIIHYNREHVSERRMDK